MSAEAKFHFRTGREMSHLIEIVEGLGDEQCRAEDLEALVGIGVAEGQQDACVGEVAGNRAGLTGNQYRAAANIR